MGRSVAELVSYVTQHPELTASTPQPITIDGHAGQAIDVQIAPSSTAECPVVGGPFVLVFTESGRDMTNSGLDQWALWKTSKARIILLDLGDGDVVLIDPQDPRPEPLRRTPARRDADRRVAQVQVIHSPVIAAPGPRAPLS